MPRASRTQTTTRTGSGEGEIAKPVESVTSGRLFIQNPYMNVKKSQANAKLKMADSIRNLGKTVNQVMDDHQKRKDASEHLEGQQAALQEPSADLQHYRDTLAKHTAEQSGAFTKGYAAQTGRKNGYRLVAETKEELMNGDFGTERDVDAIMKGKLSEFLEGVEDEDYRAQVMDVFMKHEEPMRTEWRDQRQAESLDAITTTYNGAMRADFTDSASQGATPQELHTMMRTYQDQAKVMGISNQVANEAMLRNVEEAATLTERPELFRVFNFTNQDSDAPDVDIPGLANSPKFQAKIMDAFGRVTRKVKAKGDQRKQADKFEAGSELVALVKSSSFQEAKQHAAAMVANGYSTASEGLSAIDKINKQEAKVLKVNKAVELAVTGDLAQGSIFGLSKAEMNAGMVTAGRQIYANANPQNLNVAHNQVASMGIKNGIIYQPHKEMMNSVSPLDAEGWQEAAGLRTRYRAFSPQFAAQSMTDEQDMAFTLYDDMLARGVDDETARISLSQMGDEAGLDFAEKVMKTDKAEWDEKIDEALLQDVDVQGFWNDDVPISNKSEVRAFIKDSARMFIATTRGGLKPAMEYAMNNFEAYHTNIRQADGTQMYVYHGKTPLPENFNDALTTYSDKAIEHWAGTVNADEKGYLMVPNPHRKADENWMVKRATTGQPVIVTNPDTGATYPLTINRHKLMTDWNLNNQTAIEQPTPMSPQLLAYNRRNARLEKERNIEVEATMTGPENPADL